MPDLRGSATASIATPTPFSSCRHSPPIIFPAQSWFMLHRNYDGEPGDSLHGNLFDTGHGKSLRPHNCANTLTAVRPGEHPTQQGVVPVVAHSDNTRGKV
jgi:hypothetical protein